ncbi:MAG TPA: SRPBCC family protein [Gemmatimonadales bacterium]|nr:SRPBCC family protein [Gemmatimonadales bacterium]
MRTVDRLAIAAPADLVFRHAADVERWPLILPHYRWVRILERGEPSLVEMAAWRPFGALRWPTWWRSEMWVDPSRREVRYRHVQGITAGMDVHWRVEEAPGGALAEIVHEWAGPRWPVIRRPAAEWVIGPVFIHGIASRTLAGIGRAAEATRVQAPPAARA